MENKDDFLIRDLCDNNARFRQLYEEHLILEKELTQFNGRSYLSPEEEVEKKKIQKLKLAGKDEMERMLSRLAQ